MLRFYRLLKMKSFFIAILCTMAVILSLPSCSGHAPAVTADYELVTFDTLSIDTVCTLFRNYDRPACHLVIRLDKPAAGKQPGYADALEKALTQVPREGLLEEDAKGSLVTMSYAYVRQFFLQYLLDGKEAIDSYNGDVDEASTWMNYEENLEGRVMYNADGFIGYRFTINSYSGGAHGNTEVKNCVFDVAQKRLLTLADLIEPSKQSSVDALVREELMKEFNYKSQDDLDRESSFFDFSDVKATDKFMIGTTGVSWTFDPYEIASYSMGVIEVIVPWHALKPLMSATSPLALLAEKQD